VAVDLVLGVRRFGAIGASYKMTKAEEVSNILGHDRYREAMQSQPCKAKAKEVQTYSRVASICRVGAFMVMVSRVTISFIS
jgi:hypothetical protein